MLDLAAQLSHLGAQETDAGTQAERQRGSFQQPLLFAILTHQAHSYEVGKLPSFAGCLESSILTPNQRKHHLQIVIERRSSFLD
jgi:hypothetical protein